MLRAVPISGVTSFLVHNPIGRRESYRHLHVPLATLSTQTPEPSPMAPSLGGRSHSTVAGGITTDSGTQLSPLPAAQGFSLNWTNVFYVCCFLCLALEPSGDLGWPSRVQLRTETRGAGPGLAPSGSGLPLPSGVSFISASPDAKFWLVLNT